MEIVKDVVIAMAKSIKILDGEIEDSVGESLIAFRAEGDYNW